MSLLSPENSWMTGWKNKRFDVCCISCWKFDVFFPIVMLVFRGAPQIWTWPTRIVGKMGYQMEFCSWLTWNTDGNIEKQNIMGNMMQFIHLYSIYNIRIESFQYCLEEVPDLAWEIKSDVLLLWNPRKNNSELITSWINNLQGRSVVASWNGNPSYSRQLQHSNKILAIHPLNTTLNAVCINCVFNSNRTIIQPFFGIKVPSIETRASPLPRNCKACRQTSIACSGNPRFASTAPNMFHLAAFGARFASQIM